jgi:hypothetical protein
MNSLSDRLLEHARNEERLDEYSSYTDHGHDCIEASVKLEEIERLRGLLRECCAALGWQGHNEQCLDPAYNDYDPACPECLLLKRVREALGE